MDRSIRMKERKFKLNKDFVNRIKSMNEETKSKKIEHIAAKITKKEDNKLRIEPIRNVEIKIDRTNPTIKVEYITKKDNKKSSSKFILYDDIKMNGMIPFNDNYKPNFSSIQNNKIIESYQKKLKGIKKELKQLIYENRVIENNNSKTDDILLLNRLNDLLNKLDKLKGKYSIDKLDRYDENYIYTMIEDYIKEFNDKKKVKGIKNSDIYILISEKLNELSNKKERFEQKVNNKKTELLLDEQELEKLKEKYNELDRFNIFLLDFQNEQDKILKEMNEALENAVDEEEKIEIKLKAMDKQSKKLLDLIGVQLLLPIPNVCKKVVTSTALYMHYIKQMIRPELETKKYKIIKINDYSNTLDQKILSLEETEYMLNYTEKEVDKLINKFKKDYSKFFGKIASCDELLHNLEKIKYEFKDRSEEINDIKEKQMKNLEKNNKVKTLYNM